MTSEKYYGSRKLGYGGQEWKDLAKELAEYRDKYEKMLLESENQEEK